MATFGDAEAAAIAILTADAAIIAKDVTVSTTLVGLDEQPRWLQVHRAGGVPTAWMGLDNAQVAIAAYGETQSEALDLINAARAAILAARGIYTGWGLALYDVSDQLGVAYDPDPLTPSLARYTLTLTLVTRPA